MNVNRWFTQWTLTAGLHGERSFNFDLRPFVQLSRRVGDVSVTQSQRLVVQHANHCCRACGEWCHSRFVLIPSRSVFQFCVLSLHVSFSFFVFFPLAAFHYLSHFFSVFLPFILPLSPLFHIFFLLLAFLLVSPIGIAPFTSSFPPCPHRSAARQYAAGVWKTDRKMVCKSLPLARHAGEESSDSSSIFRSRLSL